MATLKNASLCQNHAINGERDAEKANYPHSAVEKKVAELPRRGREEVSEFTIQKQLNFRIAPIEMHSTKFKN